MARHHAFGWEGVLYFDFKGIADSPVRSDPWPHILVERALDPAYSRQLEAEFPDIPFSGAYVDEHLALTETFRSLVEQAKGDRLRAVLQEKLEIDLEYAVPFVTLRGRSNRKNGRFHADSTWKLVTVLLYMNTSWPHHGGNLLLTNGKPIKGNNADGGVEVPAAGANLVAWKNTGFEWHGYNPIIGRRNVFQINYCASEEERDRFYSKMKLRYRYKRVTQFVCAIKPDIERFES